MISSTGGSLTFLLVALAGNAVLAGAIAGETTSGCWRAPLPQTVEEFAVTAANPDRRRAVRTAQATSRATLALSNPSAPLKAAYGAGLLVGWGETGSRPEFSLVTAVGASALVAPFAFLGAEEDGRIADLFACGDANLAGIAQRATTYLDATLIERIARRHEAGARLLVALPGSAARSETVWDLGAIAASRHPKTFTLAEVAMCLRHVRSTPGSRHHADRSACLFRART
jgi:hypothetical protein